MNISSAKCSCDAQQPPQLANGLALKITGHGPYSQSQLAVPFLDPVLPLGDAFLARNDPENAL
ncbi:MAG: hypothetical protein EA399_12975 [Desulfovibrionales bacterium]|nr:MAG: hypothetical protein EA399_12975 [Desulfovibrionales bacterium]